MSTVWIKLSKIIVFFKKFYYLCFKNLKSKKELQMIKNIMQSTFGETDANA